MSLKEMIVSIVTVMAVVAIFAAIISPASAGAVSASKVADRTECSLGEDITYTLKVTNIDEHGKTWTFDVYDQYANDGEIWLVKVYNLPPGGTWSNTTTFTVDAGDESSTRPGWVINNLRYEGRDSACMAISGSCGEPVKIIADVNFTTEATGCKEVTINPTYSGPVAWHQWIINSVPAPVVNTTPDPTTLTSCGVNSVILKGGPNTSDYTDCVTFSDTIYVAGEPIVWITTSPGGDVNVGDPVTFSIASLTSDTPIGGYQWTFTGGLTGSSDTSPTTTLTIPAGGVTATLTVVDTLGCEGDDIITVRTHPPQQKPPSEVPLLTPVGMFALIGMLCIVGAGRILMKDRRS